MRAEQRDYFKTRNPSAMGRARALEARVDQAVRQVLEQGTLFESIGEG